jgi:thiamine kinase-like enzyme
MAPFTSALMQIVRSTSSSSGEIVARLDRIAPARLKSVGDLPFFANTPWLALD